MQVIIEESEYKRLLEGVALLKEVMDNLNDESKKTEFALSLNGGYTGMGGYREYPVSFIIFNPSDIVKELVKRNEDLSKELSRAMAHLKSFSEEIEPVLSLSRRTFKQIINDRHGPHTFPYSWHK